MGGPIYGWIYCGKRTKPACARATKYFWTFQHGIYRFNHHYQIVIAVCSVGYKISPLFYFGPSVIVECNVDVLRHCVSQLPSPFPPIHCSIVSFLPQSHPRFLFSKARPPTPSSNSDVGARTCYWSTVSLGENVNNCTQSAFKCQRFRCTCIFAVCLSSNLLPHTLNSN